MVSVLGHEPQLSNDAFGPHPGLATGAVALGNRLHGRRTEDVDAVSGVILVVMIALLSVSR